jgi:hypothetical protein
MHTRRQQQNRQQRTHGGATGDAENVWVAERIARHQLDQRPSQRQRCTRAKGRENTRHTYQPEDVMRRPPPTG